MVHHLQNIGSNCASFDGVGRLHWHTSSRPSRCWSRSITSSAAMRCCRLRFQLSKPLGPKPTSSSATRRFWVAAKSAASWAIPTLLHSTPCLPDVYPVEPILFAIGSTKLALKCRRRNCRQPDSWPRRRYAPDPTALCWNVCYKIRFRNIITLMATVSFDTLQLVEQLRTAGIPQEQAEAVVRVIA